MNGIIGISGVLAILLAAGGLVALVERGGVSVRWLSVAAGLVLLNDLLLTRAYGLLPDLLPGADWNWQGKLLALAGTLAVASLPAFGWRASGSALPQAEDGWRPVLLVSVAYVAVFLGLALAFPTEPASAETVAFQLSLPGLEEEPFYRGVLLLALFRAFPARRRILGVDWSWGAVVSCALFGLAHAFGYSKSGFQFDPLTMLLTAGPSFIAVWLALRTRSVLLPVLLHNFGNAITLVV
ncbi:CPBP family intramembrane glutamic endopeptidase, BDIM_20840 family [Phenylobacterium sp.]|uniref:CPBP family intramembrane glutamic endopeptidase, BDIM_20840 family n=1 Tax=Phenylobacterium sp. TaxID=1871053 RepID=UPI002B77EB65|nr:CPBP family intramembrane glutamic endopeptidase [Phenylobacterium sp.]HVI32095.1 CPBP family intramembrane glutamic endopeptidase [Phenylobacterium sp.]